ncbi:hypothetical protein EMIT019CA3_30065 [Bacillus pseudomycoides]
MTLIHNIYIHFTNIINSHITFFFKFNSFYNNGVFIYIQIKIAVDSKELLVNKLSFQPTAVISIIYPLFASSKAKLMTANTPP